MQRSLFAGVSGLTNHQAILDVTANNLANVSTPGFKSSRISFSTAMNQTSSVGSASSGSTGGINPRQIGLGVTSGSIDIDVKQGALLSTGRTLDLAIQGQGFFKLTNTNPADGVYFSRVGNFGFDESDDLVDLASGLKVNGTQNGNQGTISLTQFRSINANATTQVTFQGNLDANTGSLRGKELSSVLPLVEASADRSTFTTGSESTVLARLNNFRGATSDPGTDYSGTFTETAGTSTSVTLQSQTELTTGGILKTQFTVPAANYSGAAANNLVIQVQRAGVVIDTLTIDQNLSGFTGASDSITARTFTYESPVLNAGDAISFVATRTNNVPAGSYTFSTSVNTNLTVLGTKPNGEAYAGKITVDPWKETVADLVSKINGVLTQGTRTFASVSVSSGNLVARALEAGDGFSLFIGEDDKLPLGPPESSSSALSSVLTQNSVIAEGSQYPATIGPVAAGADGALRPTFTMPSVDLSSQVGTTMAIAVKVNGTTIGSITVPAADYTSASVSRTFTLQSYPQVSATDLVSYEFSGNLDLTPDLTAGADPQTMGIVTNLGRLSEQTSTGLGINYRGTALAGVAAATMSRGGLIQPTITMPSVDLSSQTGRSLKVSMKINGQERASLSIAPGDYRGGAVKDFTIPNLPHVAAGDIVTFDLSGTLDLGSSNNLTWQTSLVADNDSTSILQDTSTNGTANGKPDLFEDDPVNPEATDINRWQYAAASNTNFDWYRLRFSPAVQPSSIDVYDSNGTKHTVETRFFKTGTKVADDGTRTNVWDMIAAIDPTEGTINGDLITGMQFDHLGRFVGGSTLGTTPRGIGLDADSYRGEPDNNRLGVIWNSSGPSAIEVYLGATNGTDGLTGFGSTSTAAAISQDGYANGNLESMSVQANGDIKGLYSNGQSQTIGSLLTYTFRNPAGLLNVGGNLWQPSSNSGQETSRTPGSGGAGSITSGSLEGSNVDIASEFTRLITAQRGFQVNARVIQTTDQILQELSGLIR